MAALGGDGSAAAIRVVCVDDDRTFRELVAAFLGERHADMTVETADTGEAVIGLLDAGGIDCVISDFRMPRMDGIELLSAVRERSPGLPFILFTARGGEAVAAEAVSAGVTDYIQKSTDPNQFDLLANRVRNAVERHRARVQYRNVFDAISEAVLVIDSTDQTVIDANRRARELWEYDEADMVGMPVDDLQVTNEPGESSGVDPVEAREPAGRDVDRRGDAGLEGPDVTEWPCLTRAGRRFWGAVSRQRATIDGRERTLVIVRDVTRRKIRQRQLDDLLETVRELLVIKTGTEIASVVERTAEGSLRFADARVYLLDRTAKEFEAPGDGGSHPGDRNSRVPAADAERLWDALDSGDLVVVRDDAAWSGPETGHPGARDAAGETLDDASVLYVPLGEFGVLRCSASGETDSHDVELAALLATFAAGALDRSKRETELREREAELRDQRDELLSLDHVNAVIRDINQALVSVSSREGIERLVCEKFVATDPYRLAWLGSYDSGESVVRPSVSAGRNEGYVPETIAVDENSAGAVADAVTTRSVVVVDRITPATVPTDRYHLARDRGFRSVAFVPVVHEEVLYRILAVYADEPHAFAERERAVLGELGETIGHALAAAEWRSARISETVVELDVAVERDGGLFDLATGDEARIELTDMRETDAGTLRVFGRVVGTTYEAFEAAVDGVDSLAEPVRLAERDGTVRVAYTIRSGPLLEAVTTGGVSLRRGTIADGSGRFQLTVPSGSDVRWIVDRFGAAFDSVELLSRRDRHRADPAARIDGVLASLTDRQQESLRTAYHAGYFATPREATGTDVASLLGVTQPTFNEHLRNAERRLFEGLLDSESAVGR